MQRIIQINIAGRVLPIEEDAYTVLKDYITSLQTQFAGDDGKEIIEDIENRISELFTIRLQSGSPAIDRSDVQKVIDTLGAASDLHDGTGAYTSQEKTQSSSYTYASGSQKSGQQQYQYTHNRLLRNPYDKVFGGVCSGLAVYFDIDPIIIRLLMVVLLFTMGIGFLAYLIAWAVIPAARSRDELYNMNNGAPITFHDITRNVGDELQDLKKRGEQMSRELKDFFSKKK
jgi:phage shock protein PspC (stress-responsive transcriptional regulator)